MKREMYRNLQNLFPETAQTPTLLSRLFHQATRRIQQVVGRCVQQQQHLVASQVIPKLRNGVTSLAWACRTGKSRLKDILELADPTFHRSPLTVKIQQFEARHFIFGPVGDKKEVVVC